MDLTSLAQQEELLQQDLSQGIACYFVGHFALKKQSTKQQAQIF